MLNPLAFGNNERHLCRYWPDVPYIDLEKTQIPQEFTRVSIPYIDLEKTQIPQEFTRVNIPYIDLEKTYSPGVY